MVVQVGRKLRQHLSEIVGGGGILASLPEVLHHFILMLLSINMMSMELLNLPTQLCGTRYSLHGLWLTELIKKLFVVMGMKGSSLLPKNHTTASFFELIKTDSYLYNLFL